MIIFLLLLITQNTISFCTNQEDEATLFAIAQTQVKLGNYSEAEKTFKILLKNYHNSERIGLYYLAQDEIFTKIIDSLKNNLSEKRKSPSSYKKGRIKISFGQKDEGEIGKLQQKRTQLFEYYIINYPKDTHREKILELLMAIYIKNNPKKFLTIANELISSKNYTVKKLAILYKAMILHKNNELTNAIKLYKTLINMIRENNMKAKYQLYISDCYYRLGEKELAFKSLDKVDFYEKDMKKKYMSRMAAIWRDYYKVEFEKPINEREQFVFFE